MANVIDQDQQWLINALSATLDPNHEVRSFAEASLNQASLQPGFGVALSKVAANRELPVGLRQLAAVLLKQFIKKHWQEGDELFEHPAVSNDEKAAIRQLLLLTLDDSHRKICTAISMAVASIAIYDWPEEWPELLPCLLNLMNNRINVGDTSDNYGGAAKANNTPQDVEEAAMLEVNSSDNVDKIALAEQYKNQGNEFLKNKDFTKAIEMYTKAIEYNPNNAIYYANRSLAHLRQESFGFALQDGISAVKSDPAYIKGYYRRAAAHMSLGKFKQALSDFEYVSKCRPNDKEAKMKFTECNKIVKMRAFERAIAVDKPEQSLKELFSELENIAIEDDYNGPALEDDKVTLKFMLDLMEHYKNQKKLHRKYACKILANIHTYMRQQPSLVDITVPDESKFTICGDIHGQFYDLMNIFEINGLPSPTNPYLFNGDFVDRGSFSVECIFTLFGFKLLYPNHFFMSRGNHESINMNQMYGFTGEVSAKYTSSMADLFTQVFNWLPLCHCINSKILVMHGGLFSSDSVTLDDLRRIQRNCQPPEEGLMCELLWSDPQSWDGRGPSKRGVGIQFGPDVTEDFCKRNNLQYIVRSHEVKDMGYEVTHNGKCITVFSAPNYCDTMGNMGAFITIKGNNLEPKFQSFEAVPHPDVKPMAYANSLMSLLA